MKPEDILSAIGDVDDAFIRKAHQKSFLKAFAVFLAIVIIGIGIMYRQCPELRLLLRYNPDGSILSGYVEPEAVLYQDWTSMEYTAYHNGEATSSTVFQKRINASYSVTHSENETITQIVGTNGDNLWVDDFLGEKHYANRYISTTFSVDLIDRIDRIYVNGETACGRTGEQLNCVGFAYLERGSHILRQTLYANGGTPEEQVVSSRGYDYRMEQISGWKEWDPEQNLLAYAQYHYDGNTQTVTSFLADGTPTGTRVSQYSFGKLRWREYYDARGELTGREVYHYRFWEPFLCVQGIFFLTALLSVAATVALAIWDDRIRIGTRLVYKAKQPGEIGNLIQELKKLELQVSALSGKAARENPDRYAEELTRLTEELQKLNDSIAALSDVPPDKEQGGIL